MNKKKLVFLAIMMVFIIVLSSALFVACDKNKGGTTPADEDEQTETVEPTEGLLISNSDFKVLGTTGDYPLTISDWTGAKSYSSGSYPTGVIAGGISLDSTLYSQNKSAWGDDDETIYNLLKANGRYGDDDEIKHALMIYMPKKAEVEEGEDEDTEHGPTAYGYTSKSFTIEKNKVYKLSVDVLTYDLAAAEGHTPGARIYVSSQTYAEFAAINTNGEWKTYELYIEGSSLNSASLTLALSLGKYTSSYQEGLTSGYAFFDNVVLETVTEEEYAAAVASELSDNSFVQTTTLKVPNGRFEYGTMTFSSTTAPDLWSFVSGNKSKDDPAPTSLAYNAIIDVNKFADHSGYSVEYYLKTGADAITTYKPANDLAAIETLITNFPSQRIGSKVYALSQHMMTASSIKTNRTITFEKNKLYALSIDVFTYDVHGAGVSLILTGSDGKDIIIKGISSARSDNVLVGHYAIDPDNNSYVSGEIDGNTTGEWKTYTFYIQGNQYKDYSYNLSVWLGTEGTNSNTSVSYKNYSSSGSSSSATTYKANGTFANGWVFVDELRLTEIEVTDIPASNVEEVNDAQTLDCSLAGKQAFVGLKVDLSSENLFDTTASGNSLQVAHATSGASLDGNGTTQAGIPNGWVSHYDVTDSTNPIIAGGIITDGLVSIDTEANFTSSGGKGTYPAMPYEIATKTAYMIHSSKDSYYEVESAPFTVEANGFYRLSLWVKTVDVKSTAGMYVYLLNADGETLSSFTAINTKDYSEYTSDWCELTFLIRGSLDQDEDMRLKFTLGTGNRWAESTLTSGAAFVSNMCLAPITYSTFSGTTTGTYVKSVNRTSSTTYTFTNGSFDEYNLSDDKLEDGKALKDQTVLAQPTSWTISDATLDANTDGSDLLAGVFELENVQSNLYFDHSAQTTAVFAGIVDAATFDAFYGDEASADYISSENFDKIAGPNVLAIASKGTPFAVGYASSKFTLSSNGIYAVSVYLRGAGAEKASIYLTGEAPSSIENSMFLIENPAADWTKYTFYVEVGSTSVSLSLNVWLGYNNDYVGLDNADDAKSAGAVFFDNVIKKSVSEEVLTEAKADVEAGATDKKVISFMTDSFDSLSETVDSRAKLTTPSNWSYTAGTDQLASNTKSGILYADPLYLPAPNTVEGTDYVSILGKAYTVDDVTITASEEEEIRSHYDDPEASADQIEADLLALREQKLVELKKDNWFPVSALSAHSGKNLLVINNMKASAFTYTSSSLSFSADSFYKVSVWVRTFGLKDGIEDGDDDTIGAYIELYLGSKNEEDNPLVFKAQVKDEWTLYTFYVKTLDETVSNVNVKLSLGTVVKADDDSVTGLTAGYAMFDDVTIEKTTEAEYNAAVETPADNVLTRQVKEEESGEADDDNTDDNTPKNKFNLEYLWWMIPTIILGALIIIVVVVFFAKKITKKAGKKSSSVRSKDATAKKRSRYDENKE